MLYRKEAFEFEALIPCILSSIVAFMVFTFHDGNATIFHIPQFSLATPAQLPFYAVLGVLCAVVGFPYVWFFYGARDRFFRRLKLPRSVKPAIGGLMVGSSPFSFLKCSGAATRGFSRPSTGISPFR